MAKNPQSRGAAHLALDSWEALMGAHRTLSKIFHDETSDWHELSMREYDVLYTLAKADGPMRLCDLTENVLLSQPAISRLVDRLSERELIEKSDDPEDGRVTRLSLTEEGAKLQREIGWAHGRSILREFSSRLSADDQRELLRICENLKTGVKDEPNG